MRRGLVVGRFQPYHMGHHKAILKVLKQVDELVIVIGSPMKSFEAEKNPFTCGERIEMIAGALKASHIYGKCYIIPVPDIQDNSLWVSRVASFCPGIGIVYTNNTLVEELFSSTGYTTHRLISGEKDIKSEYVRYWLEKDMELDNKVPKSVIEYLTRIGAGARIRRLSKEEEKQ